MASMDLDLCYLTATEAIDQFKAKKLSPVELMRAVLARCEAVNPKLNVLTYTFAERALEQAKASEARYMKGETRPLEGIPVAIKDFHPVRGEITTFGSLIYKDFRPDNTAPTIERLFNAGAIMHCRTTTPEFAHSGVTKESALGYLTQPLEP
ncbi:MAG: amidase family protein [Candidatus Binataceae bacterium]